MMKTKELFLWTSFNSKVWSESLKQVIKLTTKYELDQADTSERTHIDPEVEAATD